MMLFDAGSFIFSRVIAATLLFGRPIASSIPIPGLPVKTMLLPAAKTKSVCSMSRSHFLFRDVPMNTWVDRYEKSR
jgi:hypothetical protein